MRDVIVLRESAGLDRAVVVLLEQAPKPHNQQESEMETTPGVHWRNGRGKRR
jgi:hypothetical protein